MDHRRGKVCEFADVMHGDVLRAAAELALFAQEAGDQLRTLIDRCRARLAVVDDGRFLPLQWDSPEPGDQ